MLTTIANQLVKFPLKKRQPDLNKAQTTAAVLVILHGEDSDPQVVLTQRASHLKSHAGEVAFPGGMWDQGDENLLHTALREANEEIGLNPHSVTPVATLPSASPKRREVSVTPFVAIGINNLELTADASETAAIFNAPLKIFMDLDQYEYFEIKSETADGDGVIRFPYLTYNNYKIWGFTLKVITDLLNSTLDAGIDLKYPQHVSK
jgi:8-oxo-dGTP pyrophosphatase MutT (NUDIX family)|tara:strand:- start:488 stop:1105 length:618 start_codon:yes stop_codon:yes gene_type:complete